ncbi:enoyl-CoA hydratase [Ureibacillus massiliensis 4400831 = CIP 108448 = CCUG 49529]|uniref:Enoyl-CoA hydratase n=1 Tax=Ureibacillus massiliensis 4400831 = CIP 108448 = CCUG 49529 TaxID=1211035 RepID=A0A0A3J1D0_9BACL|nr:enoyl-CoA hydratase-related protein [Ureibacillus massiliensis]KGR90779.1 enoyl-CoA hydratase [Ureibacillus massiliensis 4400831 = CIP 108448 = CCUG 49529]
MGTLLFEVKNHIAYITLNRPEVLNAFNYEMLVELEIAVESILQDSEIRAVILRGAGEKAFSVGADLKERKHLPDSLVIRNLNKFGQVFNMIEQLPQVTICILNGYAFGGGLELALCCDFRIASSNVKVGLTETSLGITPGAGGTIRLPKLIGQTKAMELILTAKHITSEEAYQIGLISKISTAEELDQTVEDFVQSILKNAPIALLQAKFAVKHGMNVDIQTGLQIERKAYELTLNSEDRIEALQAFAEKRKPVFKGK